MAGPFHHDVRGDAEGEGVDDEGAAAGVGADEFPLGLDFIGADITLVGGDADLLVDTGEFAQFLDVAVHRLVRVVRKGLVVLEGGILVFLKDGLGDLVQFDGNAVRRLDGRNLDVIALDVAATKVVDVGVAEAGEAAEQELVILSLGVSTGQFASAYILTNYERECADPLVFERGLARRRAEPSDFEGRSAHTLIKLIDLEKDTKERVLTPWIDNLAFPQQAYRTKLWRCGEMCLSSHYVLLEEEPYQCRLK